MMSFAANYGEHNARNVRSHLIYTDVCENKNTGIPPSWPDQIKLQLRTILSSRTWNFLWYFHILWFDSNTIYENNAGNMWLIISMMLFSRAYSLFTL